MFAEIIVDISNSEVDKIFDYSFDCDLKLGQRVLVPFGSRLIEGYCINIKEKSDYPIEKIKAVNKVIDDSPVIIEELLSLTKFLIDRYNLRIVDALRLFIPAQMRGGRVKELTRLFVEIQTEYLTKNPEEFIKKSSYAQMELFDHLLINKGEFLNVIANNFSYAAYKNLLMRGIVKTSSQRIARTPYKSIDKTENEFKPTLEQESAIKTILSDSRIFLLHGVTGSGKTEVYIRCIKKVLEQGKTAIMLVPEISLTPQVFSLFKAHFEDKVAILHSGLSVGERFDEWQRLLNGDAIVAIGARSAIFAPLKNIGIIIIDEEHDSSYNSESNPRYNTLEIAQFRQKYNNCSLVLGSATPSTETYYRAKNGEFKLIEMNNRINNKLPKIKIVNMSDEVLSGNNSIFSMELFNLLSKCLENKNQAMLFINRRGYSSFLRCVSCGYVATCERCDVSLVYHKDEDILKCHYCSNRYNAPTICPNCKNSNLRRGYIGTQQVEEKLAESFPNAKILRMDNDTTQNKDSHLNILTKFKNKEADILIGTQMIAKGHDFPLVTLVGIIDADISLHFSDYKSFERTFQLITQVSGRAGRAEKEGNVILQTYSPNHYVYRFAKENDYLSFYKKEINLREVTCFPPFTDIIRVLVSGENEQETASILKEIYEKMLSLKEEYKDCFIYLTYMRSPLKKIKDLFRMQVLARITNCFDEILKKVYNYINEIKKKGIYIFVEINPNNLN